MSVEPITKQPPAAATFSSARNAAQTWRGQCIDVFAEVEQRTNSLLIKAMSIPAYADLKLKPAFPVLVGQKYERLRKLLTIEGPLQLHGETAALSLEAFLKFHDLRNLLCHGALQVTLAEDQSPYYIFVILKPIGAGPGSTAIRQSDTIEMRNSLKSAARALMIELAALENALSTPAARPRKSA